MNCAALALGTLLLAFGACAHGKAPETAATATVTPKSVDTTGRGLVEQWRQAYEVRSLDALAQLYAHDSDLVVVQDGMPLIGWTAVETMLKDRLAHAKEVHVRLKDVQVTSLAPTVASALATMTREIGDGVATAKENGALTLVLRKDPDGWRIIAEHYSYKRP